MNTTTASTASRLGKTTRILATSIAALVAVHTAQATSGTWLGDNQAWPNVFNWSSTAVPGAGDTATFNADDVTVNYFTTVVLGGTATVGSVVFDTFDAAVYNIGLAGETLTLSSGGGVTVNASVVNNEQFDAAIDLGTTGAAEAFTVTNSSGVANLVFAGGISSGANAGVKTVTFAGVGTTQVDGVIANGAGSVALVKTGAGTLTLSNSNTYSGQTTVTAGTLSVGATDALGGGSTVLVNGGTLDLSTFDSTVGAVTLSSGSIAGSGSILTGTSFAVESGTISARLAGFGATLTKTTSGTVTLSGTNTFTGQMSVQNGVVSIATINNASTSGVLGNSASAVILGNTGAQTGTLRYTGASTGINKAFTMAAGGTGAFQIDTAGATLELTGLIDGSGALSKTGAGTLKISNLNTYSGGTTASAGSLILGNKKGFGTGPVTLAGGTFFQTSGFEGNGAYLPSDPNGALPNDFVLSGGKVTVNVAFGGANDIWINTAVSGAGGVVVTGSGRDSGLTLSGAKTFSGGVTLGTVGSSGDTPNVSIDDNASLGGGILRSELSSSSVTAGALRINTSLSNVANQIVMASGARIVIRTLGNNVTLNGIISDEGSGGNFLTADSGTVTLGNANTFKGTTTIASGGTVALANALALQNSTLSYSTGALTFGTVTAATLGGLSGSQGIALTNGSVQAVALSVGNNNASTTYSGTFTDGAAAGGSVTKTGTGTMTLSDNAALSQTGATNINGGTLLMTGSAPNIPTSAVTVNSTGTLAVNIASPLTLNNALTVTGTGAYRVQVDSAGPAVTQVNGNLNVTGTPVLKLAAGGSAPTAGTYTILNYTGTLVNSAAWSVDASLLNSAGSQVSNWTDGNSTWATAANWDQQGWSGSVVYDNPNSRVQLSGLAIGNIAPIFSTLATIAPANPAAVTGPASAATVASLTVGDGGANAHSLTLQAAAPLTVTGPVTVNPTGTLNASAAALSAGSLNLSGGSVTVGAGSSAGTANLTSGTLAATVGGNELAVSTKLIKGPTVITAGTTPFKVGGSNLVSSIDKLMVQGGTTSIANPATITLTDVGTQWTGTSATSVSNNFTVTPGANVLVVTVNQRTLTPTGSAYNASTHPTVTYDGVAMTLDNAPGGAYGYGQINGFVNSQVFYMLNAPTGAANLLDVSFPYAGTDYVVNAFTLAGVSTTVPVKTNGYVQETTNTPSNVGISLTGVTVGSAVVTAYMQRNANAVSTTTSSGTLDTSGTGGGSGDFWSNIGTSTASAGALALGVNSGTVTIAHSSSSAAREIFAAAAFAPAASALTMSSTAVNVTSSNTLDFGGAPSVSLGRLTLEAGSSLSMTNAPVAGVSFSSIVGNGSSQIAGGVPISLRSPSPTVTVNAGHLEISAAVKLEAGTAISTAAGSSVTFAGNITTPVSSGDFNVVKSGLGTMNITGTVFAAGSSPNRIINMTGGTTNFTNATVHVSSLISQTNNNVYMTATNSIIDIDDAGWYHGGLRVGWGNGVYSYAMNGGSLTLNPFAEIIRVAGNGNTGRAILSLDGGATVSTGGIDVGETDNTYGEINIRDASIANSWEFRIGVSKGLGVVNQLGATSSVVNDLPVILTYRMGQTTCWGIYNLNAGTLKTDSIVSGDGNTQFNGNRAFVNFHGGTLIPKANSGNFIYSTLTGSNAGSVSAPQLMVYSDGAIIDTDGKNITIGEKLLAPTGQGVSATTIVLAGPSQGSGYRGEPVITIGNTANFSATAVANMVDDGTGNGTFKIVSITVTNPGVNFTSAPALNIYGGDPTLAATLPATVPTAANVSGGLTKNGAGKLTLSAANTYAGATFITAGTLIATNAASLGTAAGGTTVTSGAALDVRANLGSEALTIGGTGVGGTGALLVGANASTGTVGGPVTLTAHTTLGGPGTLNMNGAVSGGFSLTKIGSGTTSFGATGSLAGVGDLTVEDGTTNVNSPLGGGASAVTVGPTAAATLKFGSVSQTLGSLSIGAGSTVTFTSGVAAFSGGSGGKSFGGALAVPEPGSLGLLLVGALGLWGRRRRQG